MRTNFPIISDELNDLVQELYYKLTYLLGYVNESYDKTSNGIYDLLETRIRTLVNNTMLTLSANNTTLIMYDSILYRQVGRTLTINELRSF